MSVMVKSAHSSELLFVFQHLISFSGTIQTGYRPLHTMLNLASVSFPIATSSAFGALAIGYSDAIGLIAVATSTGLVEIVVDIG